MNQPLTFSHLVADSVASQDKFELEHLLHLLWLINPRRILEVGVHRGGMLETLRSAFPDAELFGIDNDFQFLEFKEFHQILGDSHEQQIYDDTAAAVGDGIDFLFIDGDHNYLGVWKDYDMYRRLVRPGGVIAFHDIMRPAGLVPGVEVRKFWDEVRPAQHTLEIWAGSVRTDGPHVSDAPGIGVIFT